ncbi:MAG: NifB/NifX family molybdenum-iron cluster-binding protein [Euryarchaeota archaeon]|nr:NifB/NifX family molybdenum-iron cluster-binding protein [Euryarchaeota archaeon]HNS25266.1 NifB/NifX family molybdenum-iron cluster-binding protein [Methanobacteriaceae archaeon]
MISICIPVMENLGISSSISQHFGKTPYFALIKLENDEIKDLEVVKSLGRHAGGTMTPAEAVSNTKAQVLVCGNLGSKAIQMLGEKGILVYVGASGTVETALKQLQDGVLSLADDSAACSEGH